MPCAWYGSPDPGSQNTVKDVMFGCPSTRSPFSVCSCTEASHSVASHHIITDPTDMHDNLTSATLNHRRKLPRTVQTKGRVLTA